MKLGDRPGLSHKAQSVLRFLAGNTTVEGLTFVKAATISRCAEVPVGDVEGLLDELAQAGQVIHLTRHGEGYRLQVVEKAGVS